MWLVLFLLLSTLTVLCAGSKDTSCSFDSYYGWCSWKMDNHYNCQWKRSNRDGGYLYLNGTNRCSSRIVWEFGMWDGSATNYLTIEYYVTGPGPFSLSVSNEKSSEPGWTCSIQPGKEKRLAHISVRGDVYYIYITGEVAKNSGIIITQIWNSLRDKKVQQVCPLITTTPRPTTRPTTMIPTTPPTTTRPTIKTTTPTTTRPTTKTTLPTTIPTTKTTTPTTTRPTTKTTTPTTTRPTTKTTRPTTTRPTKKPTTKVTTPTTTRLTTRPTTKTTTPTTTRPTTRPTTKTTTRTTTRPTTKTTIPTTIPTTKTTTPTTTRPTTKTTTSTTTRPTTKTTTPTTTIPTKRPTTKTTTPTTTRLTTRPTTKTTTPTTTISTKIPKTKTTTPITTRPTTKTTPSAPKSSRTRFKTSRWKSTINISKSTAPKIKLTTTKKKSGDQTTETVLSSTLRNRRTSSISNVATSQSIFSRGLTSVTERISKNNDSSVVHFVSTHPTRRLNRSTITVNMDATNTREPNPGQTPSTGSGNSSEWTTHNPQVGNAAAEIKNEKTEKIIIGSILGVLAVIVLITIVIVIKKRRRSIPEPFSDQVLLSDNQKTVYFSNSIYV